MAAEAAAEAAAEEGGGAGRVVLSKKSLRVVEGGACDFYTIRLTSRPRADVMVQVDESSGQVRTSPKVVRFSCDVTDETVQGHWAFEQIVRVMAIDDDNVEAIRETAALTHCSLSGDPQFSSVSGRCIVEPAALPVDIVDNDGGYVCTFGEISAWRDITPVARSLRCTDKSNGRKLRDLSTAVGNSSAASAAMVAAAAGGEQAVVEESIRSIACGAHHACVTLADGRVMMIGNGSSGQLGQGDFRTRAEFVAWRSIDRDGVLRSKIVQVACGAMHSALVTDDGRLLVCGSNERGQLGVCDGPNAGCIECLQARDDQNGNVDMYSEYAKVRQRTRRAGACRKGKSKGKGIGRGKAGAGKQAGGSAAALETSTVCAVPRVVEFLTNLFVERVACGDNHTVVLASTGSSNTDRGVVKCRVFGWGDSSSGALGGRAHGSDLHPFEIVELSEKDPFQISCGARHTAVLCGSGELYTSGWGLRGCLGRRVAEDDPTLGSFAHIQPTVRPSEKQPHFVDISSGHSHLGALSDSQHVFVCGSNESGQLGLGDTVHRSFLTRVDFLSDMGVSSLAFGMFHSCASTWDGDLYVWGSNDHGQLGLGGHVLQQSLPVLHRSVHGSVKQVQSGKAFSAAILHRPLGTELPGLAQKQRDYRERLQSFREAKRAEDKRRQQRVKTVAHPKEAQARAPRVVRRVREVDAEAVRRAASHMPYETVTHFSPRINRRPPGKPPVMRTVPSRVARKLRRRPPPSTREEPDLTKGLARLAAPERVDLSNVSAEQLIELHRPSRPSRPSPDAAPSRHVVAIYGAPPSPQHPKKKNKKKRKVKTKKKAAPASNNSNNNEEAGGDPAASEQLGLPRGAPAAASAADSAVVP